MDSGFRIPDSGSRNPDSGIRNQDVVDPLDLLGNGLFRRSKDSWTGFEGNKDRNLQHGFGPSSPLKCKLQTRVPDFAEKI